LVIGQRNRFLNGSAHLRRTTSRPTSDKALKRSLSRGTESSNPSPSSGESANSRFLDAGHTDYPVPTTAEIPSIEIHYLQTRTGASGTGAKGVGEGGTVGSAAEVLNAVSDTLAPSA
jgi:hypothetical protein